jgi:misacylated tRNA(Ala) deacylase
MSTDCLFREDSYLKECSATVVGLTEAGGVLLDRTSTPLPAASRPIAGC